VLFINETDNCYAKGGTFLRSWKKEESGEREKSEKRDGGWILRFGDNGKAMATNLLRHGFKVTVWNKTLSKVSIHILLFFKFQFLLLLCLFVCVLTMISFHNTG